MLGRQFRWVLFGVTILLALWVVVFGWVAMWGMGGRIKGNCDSKEG